METPPSLASFACGGQYLAERVTLTIHSPPFYVITGGPGSGKTTVLAELTGRGHICIPEDARAVIQQQVASCGQALPWADASRFADLLMEQSIATYQKQAFIWHAQPAKYPQSPVYFDRGIGDAFTCADLIGHALPGALCEQAKQFRYRDPVFLAPWWPEIYITDTERPQSREEAERTEHAIVKTYTELGYRIVKLPRTTPAERADFILRHQDQVDFVTPTGRSEGICRSLATLRWPRMEEHFPKPDPIRTDHTQTCRITPPGLLSLNQA